MMFGKKETPKQMAKKAGREIKRETRRIDRDISKDFERDEKRLMQELKKEAQKNGNSEKTKRLAKQLVKIRGARGKVENMKGHMETVATDIKIQAASLAMADTVGKATKVMTKVNKRTDVRKVMKNMQQYEKEMAKSEMTQEMMQATLDDVFDSEGAEAEQDELVNKVLDEVGLQHLGDMESAPVTSLGAQEVTSEEERREIAAALSGS